MGLLQLGLSTLDQTGRAPSMRALDFLRQERLPVRRAGPGGQVRARGIPWLRRIREEVGDRVHFWPFDGWSPAADKAVIAEVYPSILRKRYAAENRTPDEHDAYSVARWLAESAARGILEHYFNPPLTLQERAVAGKEGWILGVC